MDKLPAKIKLFSFSKKNLKIKDHCSISKFPRIYEMIINKDEQVDIDLEFKLVSNKVPTLKGDLRFNVVIECQRCLKPLELDLHSDFSFAFIEADEDASLVDSSFEVINDYNKEIDSHEFLTDEMLLMIPMIPKHDHQCKKIENNYEINSNPFNILKSLKKKS
jgi:uncharacterized protein